MRIYIWACSVMIVLCINPDVFSHAPRRWLWLGMLAIAIWYDGKKDKQK